MADEWRLIRDAIDGEREIKAGREEYLPKLDGMDKLDYDSYLDRGCYYNFTGRTLGALVGTLFRRKIKLYDYPDNLEPRLEHVSKTGSSFELLAETSAEEILAVARFGVLVDLPAFVSTEPEPYMVPYLAENILDWEYTVDPVTGRERLSRVVLREWWQHRSQGLGRQWFARYRELMLDGGIYVQRLYVNPEADADIEAPTSTVVPMVRGEPLDYIPFHIFDIGRSPMQDIARLNVSHYRSYAHLEHGRYYTGLPVYYTNVPEGGDADYYIGPQTVWELPMEAKAGLLEFNGRGLNSLESALRDKESQAASLGGRMIGVSAQSTAETDNQTAMKDRNEASLLHRAARHLEHGWTVLLRWWADLSNAPSPRLRVVFNKDFVQAPIGSREFRAIQSMYKDGIIPIEVLYEYCVKAGLINDEMELEEFSTLLQSAESFPNQPDFAARQEGYPNAQAKVSAELKEGDQEIADKEIDVTEDIAQKDRDASLRQAQETRKAAAEQAKVTATQRSADPGVAAQRQQLRAKPAPKK